jgi:hypothetical protein
MKKSSGYRVMPKQAVIRHYKSSRVFRTIGHRITFEHELRDRMQFSVSNQLDWRTQPCVMIFVLGSETEHGQANTAECG